jgi:hypothetical protein
MLLDVTLHQPDLVLQAPPGAFESAIDRKRQIAVAFVGLGRARDVDLATVRQREPDAHLVVPAVAMVLARALQRDAASRDPPASLLEWATWFSIVSRVVALTSVLGKSIWTGVCMGPPVTAYW